MILGVQAIEYNAEADILETAEFQYVEDAFAWCEQRRGAALEWGDTNFGYHGMTVEERENSAEGMPPRWYEVHGLHENGDIRELEEDDHKDGEFK